GGAGGGGGVRDGGRGLQRRHAREQRIDLAPHRAGRGGRDVGPDRVADQRVDDDAAAGAAARAEEARGAAVDARVEPGAEEGIAQRLGLSELAAVGVRKLRDRRLVRGQERREQRLRRERLLLAVV